MQILNICLLEGHPFRAQKVQTLFQLGLSTHRTLDKNVLKDWVRYVVIVPKDMTLARRCNAGKLDARNECNVRRQDFFTAFIPSTVSWSVTENARI